MNRLLKSGLIVLLVLILDQTLKIWIKTHLMMGQEIHVMGNWFILHFTENYGMAFGMEFGGEWGKLILSVFRIVAVAAIGVYIYKLCQKQAHILLIASMSLIMAGAMGNIIDSCFYGMIFNHSYNQVAQMFPPDGVYGAFLHGRVVDMLYFPIIRFDFPSWFPFWANEEFVFFRPVFNLADSAITAISIIFARALKRLLFSAGVRTPLL